MRPIPFHCVLALAAAGAFLQPARAADVAALKARSDALDQELGRELRRLQVYLGYEDQILGMESAQGLIAPGEAAARLAKRAADLYRKSYTDSDLRAKAAEHGRSAADFLGEIERQIAASASWPSDRPASDYRALAASELKKIRGLLGAPQKPSSAAPLLSRAAEILGWTSGKAQLSAAENPFAGSAERVITALTSEHARFVAALKGAAPAPAVANAPPAGPFDPGLRRAPATPTPPSGPFDPGLRRPAPAAGSAGGPFDPGLRREPAAPNPPPAASAARPPPATAGTLTPPPAPLPPIDGGGPPPSADSSQALAAANAAFGQGRFAEAQPLYQSVLRSNPRSPDALAGLGRCRNALGNLEGAAVAYEALLEAAPQTPNVRTWLAELSLARRDVPGAQHWLDAELAAQPNSAWALSWLGTLQLQSGRQQDAARTLAKAVALDPNTTGFRYQNGTGLATSQPQRAVAEFQTVLAMDPRSAGAYYALGECLARLGRNEEAARSYEQYLRFDPSSEWAQRARQQMARLRPGP